MLFPSLSKRFRPCNFPWVRGSREAQPKNSFCLSFVREATGMSTQWKLTCGVYHRRPSPGLLRPRQTHPQRMSGLGTLISIRWNPDFIFRNMFWLTCCAILAQAIQTTYSLTFSINGTNHRLPFLWNFSSNPEQKWWSVAIIYMTLFGLAWMCWRADRELRGNKKNNE